MIKLNEGSCKTHICITDQSKQNCTLTQSPANTSDGGCSMHICCIHCGPVRNVSWISFQEGRSLELRLGQGVEQVAHTLSIIPK